MGAAAAKAKGKATQGFGRDGGCGCGYRQRWAAHTSGMGSRASGAVLGMMRMAASSVLWYCCVATMARNPAILAGGNAS